MNCTITPNPDIAGVGVRIAIYGQAFLALIPAALALWKAETRSKRPQANIQPAVDTETGSDDGLPDPELNVDGLRELSTNSITVLLTGIALLVSAFIQARLYGLTLYHALIVLTLSWLNNVTASLSFFLSFLLESNIQSSPDSIFGSQFVVYIVHFCATGAFGLWVFATVDTFGGNAPCNPTVLYYLFGHPVSATSRGLRIFSLIEYSLAAIPLLNMACLFAVVLVGGGILWVSIIFIYPCGSVHSRPKVYETSYLIMVTFLDILLIVSAEGIVSMNASNVGEGEGDWTFGQTLAMLILIIPLLDVVSKFRAVWKGKHVKEEPWIPLREVEPWYTESAVAKEDSSWTGLMDVQCVDMLG